MLALNSGNIIRKVRLRLELSQEALSRLMNTSKGAVQHWERGRNIPGEGRLLALRQLCPASPERKELDALIRGTQNGPGSVGPAKPNASLRGRGRSSPVQLLPAFLPNGLTRARRENSRLQRQVAKLELALKSRDQRLRKLENLATDLQREMAQLRAGQ